jgi:hypothetical protein
VSDDAAGHLLHNIFAAPAEPGPPYTHTLDLSPPDPAEAVAWLREQIAERLYLAQRTIEIGNAAKWTELSSGVLMTVAADADQDNWDGVHPMGDSSLTRLMEANDPQDTIARCEAEAAILDECLADASMDTALENGDISTEEYVSGVVTGTIILRLLAAAYRHRDGYARFWGEPVTHTLTQDGT